MIVQVFNIVREKRDVYKPVRLFLVRITHPTTLLAYKKVSKYKQHLFVRFHKYRRKKKSNIYTEKKKKFVSTNTMYPL